MPPLLLAAALALAAFLLFLVEPLVARQLLPVFGGAAAVWVAALLFFQAALLAGYLAADRLSRLASRKAQALALAGLALLGLVTLPLAPPLSLLAGRPPALRVLAALAVSVGPPYLALSATGPLLQSWWARTRGAPWRLYALSNAASLVGLFAYPLAFEPLFEVRTQARLWTIGYAGYCALIGAAAWRFGASTVGTSPGAGRAPSTNLEPSPGPATRGWASLVLPGLTSALLLAVTAHLTQNVAPIPLLWVLPLAAYLVSFILAFESARPPLRRVWLPLCALGLLYLAKAASSPAPEHAWRAIALELGALLAVCTAVHAELVRERPAAAQVTGFYLRISLGSALGALFVAVGAPLLFKTELELPLTLAGCALSLSALLWREPLRIPGWIPRTRVARTLSVVALALLGLQLAIGEAQSRTLLRWSGRSFYGALRVADDSSAPDLDVRVLFHGSTVHGQEALPPADPATPLGYYGVSSAAGRALHALQATHASLRVGIVGLGIGVLAAYCRPGDDYTFYELDPLVIAVAQQQFHFLQRCPHRALVPGDARLSLAAEPPRGFDLLLLDAFASDAIPIHLLTREAFALYLRHLAPGGLLLVHVSNRFVDLSPVLAGHAAALGLHAWHLEQGADFSKLQFPNRYVLLARDPRAIEAKAFEGTDDLRKLAPTAGFRDWTDAYANLAALLN